MANYYLPRLAIPTVATLPAASSCPQQLRVQGGILWFSDGTSWTQMVGGGGAAGNIPIDVKSANYTFVAGDAGRNIVKTSNNAYTFTINNSVFSAGDWFMVSNFATSLNITIARGSGVTLYYAGSSMDTNKVVVPRGMATVYMHSASVGYVFGSGVG